MLTIVSNVKITKVDKTPNMTQYTTPVTPPNTPPNQLYVTYCLKDL